MGRHQSSGPPDRSRCVAGPDHEAADRCREHHAVTGACKVGSTLLARISNADVWSCPLADPMRHVTGAPARGSPNFWGRIMIRVCFAGASAVSGGPTRSPRSGGRVRASTGRKRSSRCAALSSRCCWLSLCLAGGGGAGWWQQPARPAMADSRPCAARCLGAAARNGRRRSW